MLNINKLLKDAIDMHLHCSPDTRPRSVDALEAAIQAQQAGMRAIVLKNHEYCTAPLAVLIRKLISGINVCGSICLDYEIGGLNYHALQTAAKIGAKVVWMPTFSSANSREKVRKLLGIPLEEEGFSILDARGKLKTEMGKILSLIKEYNMVLASGHISPAETFSLVEAALVAGISKLVITHADAAEGVDQALSLEDQGQLARMGAFIEYCYADMLLFGHNPQQLAETIKLIGAEHVVISSDLGQAGKPTPVEGIKTFISVLLEHGITETEIELMSKINPARLLGMSY